MIGGFPISLITLKEALELIKNSPKYHHMLRVSKLMKKLAELLQEDQMEWELAGLLHDIDYELTLSTPGLHGVIGAEMLRDKLSESVLDAIKSHDYRTIYEPNELIAKALISADAFDTFLILLERNKFMITKEKLFSYMEEWRFEKPWLKELIENCEKINVPLEKLIDFGLIIYKDNFML